MPTRQSTDSATELESTSIATHGGRDRVGIGSVDVRQNLNISTGSNNDSLTLGTNELPRPAGEEDPSLVGDQPGIRLPLNVRGSMNLHNGGGNDFAWLESLHVGQHLRARAEDE